MVGACGIIGTHGDWWGIGQEGMWGHPRRSDRALFETAGAPLYEEIVASGGILAGEPRIVAGGELHAAFDQLREMGLVRLDPGQETWVAEDPGLVHTRVVAPLSQQGADLLQESARWTHAFGTLAQAWRKAPHVTEGGPFRYLRGPDIGSFILNVAEEAEEEVLTAQPQSDHSGEYTEDATPDRARSCSSVASGSSRSTSTAPGAAPPPAGTSPTSPRSGRRCAPRTSSSTG